MKTRRTLFLYLAIAVALVSSPLSRAEGASLTDAELELIRTNCVNAQISIQLVQESDKSTRINRGYLYGSTLKMMLNFNSRAAQNNVNAPEMISITSDYEKTITTSLVPNYTAYDDSVSRLTQMNCRSEPTLFNDTLKSTREKRAKMSADVKKLDTFLDQYQASLDVIKQKISEGSR